MLTDYSILLSPETGASEAIARNPRLLLMFEHLEIPLGLQDKTISQVCRESGIDEELFLIIGNLFNGIDPNFHQLDRLKDIPMIIRYLENSHRNYVTEKFPLLTTLINDICKVNTNPEVELLKRFLDDYLDEVAEHLKYENTVVFPYVLALSGNKNDVTESLPGQYSMSEYRRHHDDIEEKLTDLKNLLIKYLPSHNDMHYRRKLLLSLDELEFDLHIHSLIEEIVLIPIVESYENNQVRRSLD